MLLNDSVSESLISLSDNNLLYLKQAEKYSFRLRSTIKLLSRSLVLVCKIKEQLFDRPFLIDYNIEVFKQGLRSILEQKKLPAESQMKRV